MVNNSICARKGALCTIQVLGMEEEEPWDIMATSHKRIRGQRKMKQEGRGEPLNILSPAK